MRCTRVYAPDSRVEENWKVMKYTSKPPTLEGKRTDIEMVDRKIKKINNLADYCKAALLLPSVHRKLPR